MHPQPAAHCWYKERRGGGTRRRGGHHNSKKRGERMSTLLHASREAGELGSSRKVLMSTTGRLSISSLTRTQRTNARTHGTRMRMRMRTTRTRSAGSRITSPLLSSLILSLLLLYQGIPNLLSMFSIVFFLCLFFYYLFCYLEVRPLFCMLLSI